MSTPLDERYMEAALSYARRGVGHVAPNPSVGCVIVKDGRIISRGRTAHGGRPHAEAEALERAGIDAKGATVYVTLEPCAQPGRGPACSDLLIEAQVSRVVIGCIDPNPAVNGQGIEKLKNAGIKVTLGVLEEEAQLFNAGFFLTKTESRPLVSLKLATSKNGMIAAAVGQRAQISNALSQKYTHMLRSQHDAILVGSETFLVDAPQLTTRIEGYEHPIQRFVLDERGRMNAPGFEVITENTRDIPALLSRLSRQGITRLLVEGGAKIHESFLESGLVDQFFHTQSTEEFSDDAVEAPYIKNLQKYGLNKISSTNLLEDRLDIYTRTD